MDAMPSQSPASSGAYADFRTTHWSIVLQAGHEPSPAANSALEILCRTYWYPLYAFIRRQGNCPHDAEDLTQEFFARFLRLKSLSVVAPHKGKFRTFLLVSLKHFLSDARDRARAAKRGGGKPLLSLDDDDAEHRYAAELPAVLSPENLFDRRWALTVLNNAFARTQAEFSTEDKAAQFDELKVFLSNEAAPGIYEELALKLNMTPGAVGTAVYRLRQRYGELVRAEVANTVGGPADVESELNYILEMAGQ
ncbi:MAG: hypothetical protein QOF48_3992 [Verrucomicrobiota bacterium]|jgi:RNA polymerase sigma-70 factor (ECF subfamily)